MFNFIKDYDATYTKSIDQGFRNYMLSIYRYLSMALVVTALSTFAVVSVPMLTQIFFQVNGYGNPIGMTVFGNIFMFVPIGISLYFFTNVGSMSLDRAKVMLWVYASAMGITLSYVSFKYTGQSIIKVAAITAAAFAGISIYGYTTKTDISTSYGSLLITGLIGILIASLINMFLRSSALEFALSAVSVVVFMGLIAWDTQKIRDFYFSANSKSFAGRYAIVAAFSLYINIINLFVRLLYLFGDRRNN